MFDRGTYAEAAERFSDPERIGVALYRAGEFEQAAASALGGHVDASTAAEQQVLVDLPSPAVAP